MLVKDGLVSSPYSLITISSNGAVTLDLEYIFIPHFISVLFLFIAGFFFYSISRGKSIDSKLCGYCILFCGKSKIGTFIYFQVTANHTYF